MKNKNILVFGSTGFIGRSITKRLLQNGDKLICPVRNSSRVKRNIPVSYTHLTLPTTPYV